MFYIAYSADNLGPTEKRPLTFAFNGGPGGSSAVINLGAFGPRTMIIANGTAMRPPPYDVIDNEDTLLAASDLVFIDAVGTGFSRLIGAGTRKEYYGVDQDAKAFAQFIEKFVTLNDRWNSPKYVAGESYGTARSCVLAKDLQDDGVALNGLILLSSVLEFETLETQAGNDYDYWLFLPSEAAVAAYHRRIAVPGNLRSFLQGVRDFAEGAYAHALAKGAALTSAERDAVAQQLHSFTGLPVAYVMRSDLRVTPERFEKELLGDSDRTIGRDDGRYSGYSLDSVSSDADSDPSSDTVLPSFAASFNRYVREELNYRTDLAYELIDPSIGDSWNWHHGSDNRPSALNVSEDLHDVMTVNPYLRVFSANGLYDLAAPFFATEYSLAHLGLAPELQTHITFGYYPSGHIIYLNPTARTALATDLRSFYR